MKLSLYQFYALAMWQSIVSIFAAMTAAADQGEFGLKCLLSAQTTSDCNQRAIVIPDRLTQLVVNLRNESIDQLESISLDSMTPEDIAELPPALVYLLPESYMEDMSGTGMAMLMQKHSQDSALAVKIIAMLHTFDQQSQYFDKLLGTKLPPKTQHQLGTVMAKWWPNMTGDWTHDTFLKTVRSGSPLMAYLPPAKIAPLKGKLASKFLSRLRVWHSSTFRTWSDNSRNVIRVWASLAMREIYTKWEADDVKGFEFLLIGLTASEMRLLSPRQIGNMIFSKAVFNKPQVRALFKVLYGFETLNAANLTEVLPVILQLAPRDLQQFNLNITDFRLIKSVTPDRRHSSFATDKQVLECLIAQSVLAKRLPSYMPDTWLDAIKDLHEFIYVLPISVLGTYNRSQLSPQVLLAVDSEKLSKQQALLLTNRGSALNLQVPASVLGLRGLLKALPTSVLVKQVTGSLSQNVLTHLVTSLPEYEPAMSAAVLHKVRPQLGESSVLEDLLSNKHSNQYFSLLSSREVESLSKEIVQSLKHLSIVGFETRIKQLLPQNILSVLLLSSHNKPASSWTSDELTSSPAFLGLSCRVLDGLEVVDAMVVLGNYTRELQAAGKWFPKSLQYCGQQLVARYAALKSYLRQLDQQANMLDILEPSEIHAIGGYVLSSFPSELIWSAKHRKDILKVIAQQSLPQLLEAVGNKDSLKKLASYLLVDILDRTRTVGITELLSLGSLKHFIASNDIKRIEPAAFKFVIEANEDEQGKTVCGNLETRREWFKVIQGAFGPPEQWDVGTLGLLGDWLLAAPTNSLDLIHASKWSEAIDVLAEQTTYHKKINWPGFEHPIAFTQVCLRILSTFEHHAYESAVHELMRKYLLASQSQLETIVPANKLLTSVRMFEETEHQVRVIPGLQVMRTAAKIEVLDVKEVGGVNEVNETNAILEDKEVFDVGSTLLPAGTTTEQDTEETEFTTVVYKTSDTITEPIITLIETSTARIESSNARAKTAAVEEESSDYESETTVLTSTENIRVTETSAARTESSRARAETAAAKKESIDTVSKNSSTAFETIATVFETTTVMIEEKSVSSTETSLEIKIASLRTSKKPSTDTIQKSTTGEQKELRKRRRDVQDNLLVAGINKSNISVGPTPLTRKNDNDNRTQKKLSCDAIRALGESASLALEWRDIEAWLPMELEDCLEVLGSLNLHQDLFKKIWSLVDEEVLMSNLSSLGRLVQAIELRNVKMLDLSLNVDTTLDTLAVLGRFVNINGNNGRVLEALAGRLHFTNPDMSYNGPAPVIALGAILCHLPLHTLRTLVDSSFLHVSSALGRITGCPKNCLDMFIQLALESQAYGQPNLWTAEDLATMGNIPAGLSAQEWQLVQPAELEGLQPTAVKCIPAHVFKELSVDQLAHLTPLAASIVSEEQLSSLSSHQKTALQRIRSLEPILVNHLVVQPVASRASTFAIKICSRRNLFIHYIFNVIFVSILMSVALLSCF